MPMQTTGIEIAPETIGHLMREENLRVPLSQRSYRWEAEHVEDLYKDIHGVIVEQGARVARTCFPRCAALPFVPASVVI